MHFSVLRQALQSLVLVGAASTSMLYLGSLNRDYFVPVGG